MNKKMEILFLCQNVIEANAWYRTSGIAKNLEEKTGYNITIVNWNDLPMDWSTLIQYDVILLQRPFANKALSLCSYIKNLGIKLWIDYDDNLFNVSPENKTYQHYQKPEVKSNMISILEMADAVSVTTKPLGQVLSKYSKKIHIIPNAVNEIIKRGIPKNREKIIFWRGGDSHIYNLMSHGDNINKAIKTFDDWNFDFMGYYPWFLAKGIGWIDGVDIILYHRSIFNLAPSVFHAPLFKDDFNICRSNISFLEGSFAGAVCIVPDWWGELPGTIPYIDQKSYYEALEACCKGEINITKQNRLSWEFIKENFMLDKINELRVILLNNL